MEPIANIIALILLIIAGYLLTVRTWHKKSEIEDFIGRFDAKMENLIDQFASDHNAQHTSEQRIDKLSQRVLILAGIVSNKIKQDQRCAEDDISRAKTGILLLFLATVIQILIVFFNW